MPGDEPWLIDPRLAVGSRTVTTISSSSNQDWSTPIRNLPGPRLKKHVSYNLGFLAQNSIKLYLKIKQTLINATRLWIILKFLFSKFLLVITFQYTNLILVSNDQFQFFLSTFLDHLENISHWDFRITINICSVYI